MARERTTLTELGDILMESYEDGSITVTAHVKMPESAFSKISNDLAIKISNYGMLPDQVREVINKNYDESLNKINRDMALINRVDTALKALAVFGGDNK